MTSTPDHSQDQPFDHDVAIIGGGVAGLTAAAHLARAGHSVVLIERNSQLGGRARTDDLDGVLFNQGAHALYRNGVGHTELRALGIDPAGEAPNLKTARLGTGTTTTRLPIEPASILGCKALSAAGKAQYVKWFAKLQKLDATDYADTTVTEWLRPYRSDVRAVLSSLVRLSTYSASLDILSADAAISQLQPTDGVLYLHDGWAAMCRQIATVARDNGATIIDGTAVSSVAAMPDRCVITLDDRHITASAVIVAAGGPSLTARLLGVDQEVFGEVGPAPQAAVLDLALDHMPTQSFVLGVDEPTYFSVHSPPARMAPEGKVAAVAMRYISVDDDGDADEHRRSLEDAAAIAGVGEAIRSRFLRRMPVTNGQPIASAGGMAGRPGVRIAGVDRAFVAGDWIGPRGLLVDAAIASGVDAAKAAAATLAQGGCCACVPIGHPCLMDATAAFQEERQRLFAIAYRILGSVADADDVVQEAWIRWQATDHAAIRTPAAFLTTVTSRLAIDRLRSAQRRREQYVGPWLPEPLAITDANDPESAAVMDESIMLGFMAVLERLGAVERAVFVLREVFDLGYPEVAAIVDRSEDNCRQIARRAREHVRSERPRMEPDPDRDRRLLDAFIGAVASGDPAQLEVLLHDDVVLVSDGGAKVRAARHPLIGAYRVGRFLTGLARNATAADVELEYVLANGQISVVLKAGDGTASLFTLESDADGSHVRRIFVQRNPEKLERALVSDTPSSS